MSNAGRPAIGDRVYVRLDDDLKARLDAWAAEHGVKRAEALRRLVAIGLDASAASHHTPAS